MAATDNMNIKEQQAAAAYVGTSDNISNTRSEEELAVTASNICPGVVTL